MPFSHHSHSGQFCSHAQDRLEDVVQAAIAKKMQVFAMTEHMPREMDDLYPEEVGNGVTPAALAQLFDDYYHEAVRLQQRYAGQIDLLVGMEVDWIRPSSGAFIERLLSKYHRMDLFVGSVHHVHGIPIDYNRDLYLVAREKAGGGGGGGTDERLFEDYFDLQWEMLTRLKPPIVGHFDLIRLWSDDKDGSFAKYDRVWKKILRNLDFVVEYGGLLEINSAALRKGMGEPYPNAEICKEMLGRDGQFTLSDDSHGIAQIATHYAQTFKFLKATGINKIARVEKIMHGPSSDGSRILKVPTRDVSLGELDLQWFS